MKGAKWIASAVVIGAVIACGKEADVAEPTPEYDNTPYVLDTRGITPPVIAADNPLTKQGVKLGRMLFYSKLLSKNNTQSCASCHVQANGFSDTNTFSIGVEGLPGHRQAMAAVNMAWNTNEFFWDGRAHLLRTQSIMPIQDPLEMNQSLDTTVDKLSASAAFRNQFIRAFGSAEITPLKISLALEQFMNSIISVNSKYDQFLRGEATLTAAEERGRKLFFTEFNPGFPDSSGADCAHCHGGRNFENDQYMNNGLDPDGGFLDNGRENVTQDPNDRGKFKVTSLRNIEKTPPYMHDGRFATLEEVVEHYNTGLVYSSTLDPALIYPQSMGGLQLSAQDVDDLVAFLKTLTDQDLLTNPAYADPF